jgi:predicted peroxiredoxin
MPPGDILMTSDDTRKDFGFVITKAPLELGTVHTTLRLAGTAVDSGRSVGLFLISDGVWLAKKDQANDVSRYFLGLIEKGAGVRVSSEHLKGAGIGEDELVDGVEVTGNTYKELVGTVMEEYGKVVVI